ELLLVNGAIIESQLSSRDCQLNRPSHDPQALAVFFADEILGIEIGDFAHNLCGQGGNFEGTQTANTALTGPESLPEGVHAHADRAENADASDDGPPGRRSHGAPTRI